jgi:hypothetical protein
MIIDILHKEVSEKLPYWLSPEAKLKGRLEDIRQKNREAWLEKQRQENELNR